MLNRRIFLASLLATAAVGTASAQDGQTKPGIARFELPEEVTRLPQGSVERFTGAEESFRAARAKLEVANPAAYILMHAYKSEKDRVWSDDRLAEAAQQSGIPVAVILNVDFSQNSDLLAEEGGVVPPELLRAMRDKMSFEPFLVSGKDAAAIATYLREMDSQYQTTLKNRVEFPPLQNE